MTGSDSVSVREVGLRDGLQMSSTILPAATKLEWLARSAQAGVREAEVTSFVPRHVIPQFFDAEEVVAGAQAMAPEVVTNALVVNLKGALRAFDTGLRKVTFVVSASEAHSLANVRRTTDAALDDFDQIARERDARGAAGRVFLSCAIATAFGCTLQGDVEEDRVMEIARRLREGGVDEISAADTVGYANPRQVRSIFRKLERIAGDVPLAAHFHDTRGLGLANVAAALECGVRRFDASLGGLGGCPFAPGATGNIATEDCVYLLETMGYETGVDVQMLLDLRQDLERWLPGERFSGALARAGLPKNYKVRSISGNSSY